MSFYLDPLNKAFADAVSKGDPLYTKSPVEAREILESIQKHEPASDIGVENIKVPVSGDEVTTVIFRPVAAADQTLPVIFYTHGGGWILGSPNAHGPLMEDLARQTGAAVVFPYYTPGPEKQYPVQFEQSYGVLEYIVKNGQKHHLKVDKIALAGDSVGGA
jgi:acetyl esterase/lipase